MPGHRIARILALGLALTTVGCGAIARPSVGSPIPPASPSGASAPASAGSTLMAYPSATPSPAATVVVPGSAATLPGSATPLPPATPPAVSETPLPTPAAEPSDSAHVDPELEAILHRALGETVTTVSRTGADTWCCQGYGIAFLPGPPQAFAAALGASIDDMTVAEAAPSGTGQAVLVRALRVHGADTSKLVDAWLALLDAEIQGVFTDPPNYERVVTHRTIGGKSVTVVEDMNFGFIWDCLDYLYPFRDVLFVVTDTSHSSFTQWDWPTTEPSAGEVEAIAALP